MEGRRGDEGGLGKAPNKVKLFQASHMPLALYGISAAPLITSLSCPLLSHHLSGVVIELFF